jgi:hypothetical protein
MAQNSPNLVTLIEGSITENGAFYKLSCDAEKPCCDEDITMISGNNCKRNLS